VLSGVNLVEGGKEAGVVFVRKNREGHNIKSREYRKEEWMRFSFVVCPLG